MEQIKCCGLRKKCVLTWVVHNPSLLAFLKTCRSPTFETTEGIKWEMQLVLNRHKGDFYIFCQLFRMRDDGPLRLHYSVDCKVCIGLVAHVQLAKEETFAKDSALEFKLFSASEFRTVESDLSNRSTKLTVQISLRRKPIGSFQKRNVSVATELPVCTGSLHRTFENVFYRARKNESVLEEQSPNLCRDGEGIFVLVEHDHGTENRFPVTLVAKNLGRTLKYRHQLLDLHGHVRASSEPIRLQPQSQVQKRIDWSEKEDLWNEATSLSLDGEMSLLLELSYIISSLRETHRFVYSFFPRRNVNNLSCDMKRLFHNCSSTSNVQIRAGENVLNVHKCVIGARSPVFNAMLSHSMIEKISKVINLEEIDLETLRKFLNYLYCGETEYSKDWVDVCNLYEIAHKYCVQSLRRKCSRQLVSRISRENCDELSLLSEIYEDKYLEIAVTSAIHSYSNEGKNRNSNRL